MEVDEPVKPKEQQDDLSKYNLEDYDKEENADGVLSVSSPSYILHYSRFRTIQQHEGFDLL